MKTGKTRAFLCLYIIILILLTVISLFIGRYKSDNVSLFNSTALTVMKNIRLPRILMALLIGSALASSGCVYQNVFHNALASPDVLGASTGACFGASLGIILHFPTYGVIALGFLFGILSIFLVYILSSVIKGQRLVIFLLIGMVVSSVLSAGTGFVKLVADPTNELPSITYWMMGSLNNIRLKQVTLALIPMLIGLIPLFVLRYRINALSLSDDEARTMGINSKALRSIVLICATLLTSTSVAFTGNIGWVGLIVPNICRQIHGNDAKRLLPGCALFGAAFLLISDNISRMVTVQEIPIGIVTSVIGAPVFIFIIAKSRIGGMSND